MKLAYKHGKRYWLRWRLRLWPTSNTISVSHMGHSHDSHMHLEVTYNGRCYGRIYRNWDRGPM